LADLEDRVEDSARRLALDDEDIARN